GADRRRSERPYPLAVNAEIVSFERAVSEFAAAWRDLTARAVDPNPFLDVDYVAAAVRHLGVPAPRVALASEGDRLLACLPVAGAPVVKRIPVPALAIHRHVYWGLGAPLVDRDEAARGTVALVELVLGGAGRRVVILEWLPDGADGRSAFVDGLASERPRLTRLRMF